MSQEVGGCHVCLRVVFSNAATKAKMERAIQEIAETVTENPWLGLDDALERLVQAYEELGCEPD
jgi:hypothetical protein